MYRKRKRTAKRFIKLKPCSLGDDDPCHCLFFTCNLDLNVIFSFIAFVKLPIMAEFLIKLFGNCKKLDQKQFKVDDYTHFFIIYYQEIKIVNILR